MARLLLLVSAALVLLHGTVEGLATRGLARAWERIPYERRRGGPSVESRLRMLRGSGESPEILAGLRGGVGMDELRESAAKVVAREESPGDRPEFAVEGGVAKFTLCGEHHEMPLAEVDMPLVRGEAVTALLLAAAEGRTSVVEGLLKAGASVSKANEDGDTPAHMAAYNGHVGCLQALLETGGAACLSAPNMHGAKPLHSAAFGGREEAACWLLSHNCDAGAKDFNDVLPEEMAQAEGHLNLAAVLKERRGKSGLQGITMD